MCVSGSPNFALVVSKVNMLLKTQESISNFTKKVKQYTKIIYDIHVLWQNKYKKGKIKEIRNEDETRHFSHLQQNGNYKPINFEQQ